MKDREICSDVTQPRVPKSTESLAPGCGCKSTSASAGCVCPEVTSSIGKSLEGHLTAFFPPCHFRRKRNKKISKGLARGSWNKPPGLLTGPGVLLSTLPCMQECPSSHLRGLSQTKRSHARRKRKQRGKIGNHNPLAWHYHSSGSQRSLVSEATVLPSPGLCSSCSCPLKCPRPCLVPLTNPIPTSRPS